MLSSKSRRSNIDIAYEVLRLLRLQDAGNTEIMCVVNLSRYQAQEYINWLLELGLLTKSEDEVRYVSYRASKKGLQLLSKIEIMREILQGNRSSEVLGMPEFTIHQKHYDEYKKAI